MPKVELVCGNNIEVLKNYQNSMFDSVVTDPPYGLSKQPNIREVLVHWLNGDDYTHNSNGFMGKSWDSFVPGPKIWEEIYRVLKPGGYMLVFAGTRTVDLLGISLRMAGFEIKDIIMWVYGSGFPKSRNISLAIDTEAGVKREVVGKYKRGMAMHPGNEGVDNWRENYTGEVNITAPATENSKKWDGWGTALKPAVEPIILCQKPIDKGTIADNVLKHGTGALNIDGCRIQTDPSKDDMLRNVKREKRTSETWEKGSGFKNENNNLTGVRPEGRFPANLIHDGSDEVLELFPNTKNGKASGYNYEKSKDANIPAGCAGGTIKSGIHFGDSGSAARFFYCAKASRKERDAGLDDFEQKLYARSGGAQGAEAKGDDEYKQDSIGLNRISKVKNNHPTVKPIELLRYLCRLITPPNGIILDPFMGSGSTGCAAVLESFDFIGIDMEQEYVDIAKGRIGYFLKQKEKPQNTLF